MSSLYFGPLVKATIIRTSNRSQGTTCRYSCFIKLKYSNVTSLDSAGEYRKECFRFYIAMMVGLSIAWLAFL